MKEESETQDDVLAGSRRRTRSFHSRGARELDFITKGQLPDGRRAFQRVAAGRLMAVAVTAQPTFSPGTPIPLFEIHEVRSIECRIR
jgi:hypothetical protein